MGFIDVFKRTPKQPVMEPEERSISLNGLGFGTISSFASSRAMKLSAVYCAVNQISNAVAILPINIVSVKEGKKRVIKHNLYDILNLFPCERLTHFDMCKMMVESVLLKGNAYAVINRDERLRVKSLEYVDPDLVTPMIQEDGRVKYLVSGMKSAIDQVNMIHLHQHLDEQFRGISTIRYAATSFENIWATESNAGNFFKSGSNLSGVIEASAPVNNEQKKQIKDSWSSFASEGVHVAVLPQGLTYKPISIDPSDAALLESREYGNMEIARWFLIPPSKLWIMTNESYNSVEMAELLYLSDTILPITTMIENEFNRKLFLPSEMGKTQVDFDFAALLETDKKSQAQYYGNMITNGVLSLNEVRDKLGFEPIPADEGGDAHFLQLSFGTVKDIANGVYVKQNSQDVTSNTKNDNKLGAEEETPKDNKDKKDKE